MPEFCSRHRQEYKISTVVGGRNWDVCPDCVRDENAGHSGTVDLTVKGLWVCEPDCPKCKEERIAKLLKKTFIIPSVGQVIFDKLSYMEFRNIPLPCGATIRSDWHHRPGSTRPGCGGSTGREYIVQCSGYKGIIWSYNMFDGGHYLEHTGQKNSCSESCPVKYQ